MKFNSQSTQYWIISLEKKTIKIKEQKKKT